MRIFQEVELPPTCYLPEVALWVALGRVPKVLVMASDFGEDYTATDPRSNRAALDENDRILPFDAGLSQSELRHLGLEVDYERYARTKALVAKYSWLPARASGDEVVAAELQHIRTVNLLIKERHPDRLLPEPDAATLNGARQLVEWMNGIDAQCEAVIDVARAEVFKALATGRLHAQGWLEEPGSVTLRDADEATLQNIPAAHWTLRKIDWDDSALQQTAAGYFAVQVPTANMLEVFPKPLCQPVSQTLDTYPGCVLMEDDGSSIPAPSLRTRRVGRPRKGEGLSVKAIVMNYFGDQVRAGDDDAKRESLVAQAIDFVERASHEKVGRSTVQGWFKELRSAGMPEIMPEMGAGN